jgi:ketosteroid isomerase-like protein
MSPQERLLAEAACIRLQHRYCITADRCDVEGFVALFTPDAAITVPEHPPFVGRDAIRAAMQALADTGVTNRHVTTNSVIDVLNAESARGVCYLTVYASAATPDAQGFRPLDLPTTVGEYDDQFQMSAEGWRFKSRRLTRVFRRALQDAKQNE